MKWMRKLGNTDLTVSALGLGTVKLGRDSGVKYPEPFTIPDNRSARELLTTARDLGINLVDTAPAYGASEERLGQLLQGQRRHWLLCSKVGEEFESGKSRFDFSPEHTVTSVKRSLRRLNTDVLDIVLVHSDGNDLHIIEQAGTLEALAQLKQQGLVRAFGMSTKTVAWGLAAAARCDVVMATYNPQQQEGAQVLDACRRSGAGVLIKKALASGHLGAHPQVAVREALQVVLGHPGTGSAVLGTTSLEHLSANVRIARELLD